MPTCDFHLAQKPKTFPVSNLTAFCLHFCSRIGIDRCGRPGDDATIFFYRGTAKNDLKDYQAAIADYDEAIRLNPELAEAFNNRGNAKSTLEDYQGAIADYDEAIRLKPDDAGALHNRGVAKLKLAESRQDDTSKEAEGGREQR
ncbi:MAG: tetratricopeptide repeat protein [Alphaproteobacteria bacterium]|nr:tetratricopeptide repeat protein [Alphaproteobacteria bacterium]